jgi:hypothetical protein
MRGSFLSLDFLETYFSSGQIESFKIGLED